jgi:hypothetical protein
MEVATMNPDGTPILNGDGEPVRTTAEPKPQFSAEVLRKLAKGKMVLCRKVDPKKETPEGYTSMREFKRAVRRSKSARRAERVEA